MSNILFLEKKLRTNKLGILYLSRIMKDAGHNVDLVQDEIDNVEDYLTENEIDFIMYSVMTSEFPWYFRRNKELKKKFNFISVFGGPHFTFYPEEGVDDPDVDFIVRGQGEGVVLDIIEGKTKEKVTMGLIPDLSKVPHPDRSILYKYDYMGKSNIKRFMACRDCYNSCKFCSSKRYREIFKDQQCMFNQRVSVDFIIEEIEMVRDEYPPLKLVYFNDDDFAGDKKWLIEFCEKYKEKVGLPFGGEIRANSVTFDILKMMKEAGCTLLFMGLESANKETLKILGRTVSAEQVKQACDWCHELGIKVSVENMIGLPVDDPLGDALETLEFNMQLHQIHSWVAIYQPFPQTELWQYCIDKRYLKPEKYTRFPIFEDTTQLDIPNKDKISRIQKWWYYIVKHKLPIELVKILIDLPLDKKTEEAMREYRLSMAAKELYGC